jgi:hypothetical protein
MADQPNITPAPYVRPNLNRPKIQQMTQGASFIERDAFGRYQMALKHLTFQPGKNNNPYYRADVVVLEAHDTKSFEDEPKPTPVDPRYVPGKMTSLYFATGRPGTPKDPGRPDRDDAYLTAFLRAVGRVQRGAAYDAEKALDDLIAAGKIDHDGVAFWFDRRPEPKKQEIKHPVTGEVLTKIDRTYSKDIFEAIVG